VRLVLDTNVVVSALLWRGTPFRLLEAVRLGERDHLFASPALLEELGDVLTRPAQAGRLARIGMTPHEALAVYIDAIELVRPLQVPRVIEADPNDDHVLAAAAAAEADVLVSGDRHLLELGLHQGIPILAPAEVLFRLDSRP
jgi:uncharacterized protein